MEEIICTRILPRVLSHLVGRRRWGDNSYFDKLCVWKLCAYSLSCVQLYGTSWTVAHQAPLSVAFSGKNTGVGSHSLLQAIYLTSNLHLLNCRLILYCLSHQGSPNGVFEKLPTNSPETAFKSDGSGFLCHWFVCRFGDRLTDWRTEERGFFQINVK